MTEDDKRNCCLLEIQETEAKYYKTLEDIEKVGTEASPLCHHLPVIAGSYINLVVLVVTVRAGRCWGRIDAFTCKTGEEGDPENPS